MIGEVGLVDAPETLDGRNAAGAGGRLEFAVPVSHRSVTLVDDDIRFEPIELPDGLQSAVPRRQLHFRAGRFCAMEALRAMGVQAWPRPLPRGSGGYPVWPDGVIGSITHTDGYAAAGAAWMTDVRGLGLDTERLVAPSRARELEAHIAVAGELAQVRGAGLDASEAFTLLFSAKESIFKCLYPLIGRRFGFHDVRLDGLEVPAGRFRVRLVCALSGRFGTDTTVEGSFAIDPAFVHTAVALPVKA
jgi:enterobactin synthetase component D